MNITIGSGGFQINYGKYTLSVINNAASYTDKKEDRLAKSFTSSSVEIAVWESEVESRGWLRLGEHDDVVGCFPISKLPKLMEACESGLPEIICLAAKKED